MKKLKKNSVATAIVVLFTLSLPGLAMAATYVSLGNADSFAILGYSGITFTGTNTVTGDIGSSPTNSISGLGGVTFISGANHGNDATAGLAQTDLATAITNAGQPPTIALTELGSTTKYPGVYNSAGGTFGITGTLTLDAQGDPNAVFIFRTVETLITAHASSVSLINGAQACNVFWQVGSSATLGSASFFKGNILAYASIGVGTTANVEGRLLANTGAVTLDGTNVVTKSTCVTAVASVGSVQDGTITVVKTVVNDNGGTKKVADFPLFVNGVSNGHQLVISGETNTFFTFGLYPYTVTETSDPNYTKSFSGDCDANGFLNLAPGDHKVCIITNNDKGAPIVPLVPPLIDVVKTASPLSLPNGPGSVAYTYTLRNIGTVPVTDVTMVGDTCSPIVLTSGDTNGDHKLGVNETWVYHCTTTLSATHTNTVTATGWANGISAVDIASATVVVGLPVVPPLIHVVKVPSVFTLPAPGGAVTYTYTVTNPGIVPLSDVSITDNKCTGLPGRVVGHPGDLNKNNLLDPGETWQFTCRSNLTQTTTNIGTAAGSANGLTARDFAIATVVVASPKLPNTGLPLQSRTPWDIFITAGILMIISSSLVLALKKRIV